MTLTEIENLIRDVPDFPRPGIVYKDITPLLSSPEALETIIELMAEHVDDVDAAGMLAIESRGFIFGAALATRIGMPMYLVRKRGKLPRESVSIHYELEYGVDHLELHADVIEKGRRYLIVDDLLATGGTAAAVRQLVEREGGVVAACVFVIELGFLDGRTALDGCTVKTLVTLS
ncbi:MAG: adenine phosphoribosyltransferase [Gammaproteobacteria bacterium]